MSRGATLVVRGVALLVALCAHGEPAGAVVGNTMSVAAVVANAGETGVVVEVDATTVDNLLQVNVEVTFDPALCGMITNQVVQKAGRVPQALITSTDCPGLGRIAFAYFDLLGVTPIPPGSGAIAQWSFDVLPGAAGGVFPLTLNVLSATKEAGIPVPVTETDGQLTINAAPPTNTPSATPIDTPTPTNTPVPTSTFTPVPTSTFTPTAPQSPTVTPTPGGCTVCGDANGSGTVNLVDALYVSQFTVGLWATLICPQVADVNRSGGGDVVDALFISQSTAGLRALSTCGTPVQSKPVGMED